MKKYKFKLQKTLSNPHPLIKKAIKRYKELNIDDYGVKNISYSCVNIRVSPTSQNRAFRIMDSLFKYFEKNGYKIDKFSAYTRIVVDNEKVEILINEKTILEEKILTRNSWGSDSYERIYKPTGILFLEIKSYDSRGLRLKFSDSKTATLEDKIEDFIETVFKVAEIQKQETEKREREKREYEVKRKINAYNELCIKYEIEQIQKLEEEISNFEKSQKVYSYVSEVEKQIKDRFVTQETLDWIKWAKKYAFKLNSLNEKIPTYIQGDKVIDFEKHMKKSLYELKIY